jgi:LPS export ABC transporter protein LptC/lipopolysaccharide transport protein LptA
MKTVTTTLLRLYKTIFKMMSVMIMLLGILSIAGSLTLAEQQPPQHFEGFNLEGFTKEGDKSWDVRGTKADFVGNTIELVDVDANHYGDEEVNLKAKSGVIDKATGYIHLQDDVVITSEKGTQLRTDSLDWHKEQDLVSTEDPVKITDKEKGMEATGTGLKAHPELKTAQMDKDVTVTVNTKPQSSTGTVIVITCDGPMEIDQQNNKGVLQDNVVAIQENRTLKADRMEVVFDPVNKQIKEIVCIGNVIIIQGENSTHSDRAVYSALDKKLTLVGRPKLILVTEGENGLAAFKE